MVVTVSQAEEAVGPNTFQLLVNFQLRKSPACETAFWLTNVATTFQHQSRPTGAAN
ncbi:hypothetical protein MH1LPH_19500 [Lactiplantibacillus brownii]